jgi:transglutaminase-like putative cysteine protease
VREAGRTARLVVLPGLIIAAGWARIEQPASPGRQVAWVALLGLAPALLPRLSLRLAAAAVALVLVVNTALRVSVLDARPFSPHDFFGPLLSHFGSGLGEYYDVGLPFDRHFHVYMHGVALLAIFAGCLCVGLCVAARRPAASALALLVWAAWPMTLLTGPGDLLRGAFVLGGVLFLLTFVRPAPGRRIDLALALAGVLVVGALAVSTSPAVAKGEFLQWQKWDFYTRPDKPVTVGYVWDMNFGGITFPKKITTVFRVKAPATPHYWRATTLDTFTGEGWIEGDLTPVGAVSDGGRDVLNPDVSLPQAGRNSRHWVEQRVTMAALRDDHLVGASTPVAYDPGDVVNVSYKEDGVAVTVDPLARDQRYTVWSYAPQPTPEQLEASKPLYPDGIDPFLELQPGRLALPFGTPGGAARIDELAALDRSIAAYEPLYRTARHVAAGAKSPYAAAVALEAWFRSNPAFTYSQHPHVAAGEPPLVWFVTQGRTGYCQFYAGAMALMLRSLGIPARVDAGFTTGRYSAAGHTWTVTDHDAHMWVEVWFRGYGWLPFDPTPSRGSLSGTYTTASPAFDIAGAGLLAVAARLGLKGFDLKRRNGTGVDRKGAANGLQADVPRRGGVTALLTNGRRNASLLRLLVLVALCAIALVVLAKTVLRHGRYLTRDPRRVAAACRRELADFLRDQRIAVPASVTPHELSALVRRELDVDGRPFADAVAGARFGPPAVAHDAARLARHERKRMLRSVRAALPRTRRLRGLVSLRSLGVAR